MKLWSNIRTHLASIVVAVVTAVAAAGALGMFGHYVAAQTAVALLEQKSAEHDARLSSSDATLAALAETQRHLAGTVQDVATTQRLVLEMLKELKALHDADMREMRGRRR